MDVPIHNSIHDGFPVKPDRRITIFDLIDPFQRPRDFVKLFFNGRLRCAGRARGDEIRVRLIDLVVSSQQLEATALVHFRRANGWRIPSVVEGPVLALEANLGTRIDKGIWWMKLRCRWHHRIRAVRRIREGQKFWIQPFNLCFAIHSRHGVSDHTCT